MTEAVISNYSISKDKRTTSYPFKGMIPREISQRIISKIPELQQPLPPLMVTSINKLVYPYLENNEPLQTSLVAKLIARDTDIQKIGETIQNIVEARKVMNIDEFTPLLRAKNNITNELEMLGVENEFLDMIHAVPITYKNTFKFSYFDQEEIVISRYQIARKAMDYISVFRPDQHIEEVIAALTESIIAHEIGHVIDQTLGFPSLSTLKYDLKDTSILGREERFAEYWARSAMNDNPQQLEIVRQEKLLQVAATYEMWNKVDMYNEFCPDSPFNIADFYCSLSQELPSNQLKEFVDSLQSLELGLYTNCPPEYYAVPYPQDVVYKAIQRQLPILR